MKRSEKRFILINIMIACVALVACASPNRTAPVIDANPIPTHRIKTHQVGPGETLYSIALRYDLDYKKLSKVNGLDSSYRISPGQTLNLDTSAYAVSSTPSAKSPKAVATRPPIPSKSGPLVIKKQTSTRSPSSPVQRPKSTVVWSWPVKGEVLEAFQGEGGLNKGIDIRGKLGEPVLAAADGEVVYSGSGLRGYGKLVIVKHNDQFLSAYAHNRVLVVAEGDKVKSGQKIAEVGFSGTNTAKLHFEIRLDGKPVDPLGYLPRLQ